jgi:hypothetical protein
MIAGSRAIRSSRYRGRRRRQFSSTAGSALVLDASPAARLKMAHDPLLQEEILGIGQTQVFARRQ